MICHVCCESLLQIRDTPSSWQGGGGSLDPRMHHFAIFCGNNWLRLHRLLVSWVWLYCAYIVWGRRGEAVKARLRWHQAFLDFPATSQVIFQPVVDLCCAVKGYWWYRPSDQAWFVTCKVHDVSPLEFLITLPKHWNIGQPLPASGSDWNDLTNERAVLWPCDQSEAGEVSPFTSDCWPPKQQSETRRLPRNPPEFCSFPGKLDKPSHFCWGCRQWSAALQLPAVSSPGLELHVLNHLAVSAALHAAPISLWAMQQLAGDWAIMAMQCFVMENIF